MPTKDRRVVRILAAQGARDLAPDVFARTEPPEPMPAANSSADGRVLSTAAALIDAARQAGTLDKLADEARAAAEQKIENAETLHVLVELARGQGPRVAPRIEARLAELIKENQERANRETQGRNAELGQRRRRPLRAGQTQVPLERLPGGPRRAPDRRPGDRPASAAGWSRP